MRIFVTLWRHESKRVGIWESAGARLGFGDVMEPHVARAGPFWHFFKSAPEACLS